MAMCCDGGDVTWGYNVCVRPPRCRFESGFECIRIILGKWIFFVPDPHHFGNQERNEAKHFRAFKPKKTLFLLLFALKFFVSLHLKIVLLRNETKDKKLLNVTSHFMFRYQKVFCIILLHIFPHFSFISHQFLFRFLLFRWFCSDFSCFASGPKNERRLPKLDPTPDPDLHHSKKLDLDPHQGDMRIRNKV
jgi:hypothetical protein